MKKWGPETDCLERNEQTFTVKDDKDEKKKVSKNSHVNLMKKYFL